MKTIQLEQAMESLLPYSIRIKNTTKDIIHNVKVFDFEHEKQSKIEYYCPYRHVEYNDVLRTLQSYQKSEFEIGMFRHFVICNDADSNEKQINCAITTEIINPNGCMLSQSKQMMIDRNQFQSSICELKDFNFPFFVMANIVYEFLMPETEIIIHLFPNKKSEK